MCLVFHLETEVYERSCLLYLSEKQYIYLMKSGHYILDEAWIIHILTLKIFSLGHP